MHCKVLTACLLIFFMALSGSAQTEAERTGSWDWEAFRKINPWTEVLPLQSKEKKERAKMPDFTKDQELIVVLGFWCSDSRDWVPVLLQGLGENPGIPVRFYALDREKQGDSQWENRWNITHLPTIILTEKGKELGRITEVPTSGILWRDIRKWQEPP